MPMIEYIKHNSKRYQVLRDGAHIGWLNRVTRRTTGLHAASITSWEATIDGDDITAITLSKAKQAIERGLPDPSFEITPSGLEALEQARKLYAPTA